LLIIHKIKGMNLMDGLSFSFYQEKE